MENRRTVVLSSVLALLVLSVREAEPQGITNNDVPACNGIFDFYFVLDSSGSVGSTFRDRVVPFIAEVSSLYSEPELRLSFVTFASRPIVHLNLTRNAEREAIQQGIERLRNHETGGFSNFLLAFREVVSMIRTQGGDRASVVLMMTDGVLQDSQVLLEREPDLIRRELGVRVFAVGVGSVSPAQLEDVADNGEQVFLASDFDQLTEIVERIRDAICIEINTVTPGAVCIGNTEQLILNGSGFTNNLNQDEVSCRFQTSDGSQFSTRPSQEVTSTRIVCPVPTFPTTGSVLLQVSLDGITFIGSHVSLLIDDCKTISSATPTQYCQGRQPTGITLRGSGFSTNLDQSQAQCRYTGAGQTFTTVPSAPITENTIICPPPDPSFIGVLDLQVTTNGAFFIDEVTRIQIDDCTSFGSLTPQEWCLSDSVEVIEIRGEGFTDNLDMNAASCTFQTAGGRELVTQPSTVRPNLFVCPLPDETLNPGVLLLRINNGFKAIGGSMELTINACIRVNSVRPGRWCVLTEEVDEVTLVGEGFTGNLDREEAFCSFRIEDEVYVTQPSGEITINRFTCPLPDVNLTVGAIRVRAHNGFTYLGEERKIVLDSCTSTDFTFIAWIFLALLAALILLALCALWCCLPLLTCKIVGGLPPERKEDTPEPPPPPPPPPAPVPPPSKPGRKWEVVDASYYGGRGAGGMKPMRVTWGGKGATELGSKLTKAKDANLIEVIQIAGEEPPEMTFAPVLTPPPVVVAEPDKELGCWDRIKKRLRRWYAVISSYRPVFTNHGNLGKRIIWFPGPDIQEKLSPGAGVENGLSNGNASKGKHGSQADLLGPSSGPPTPSPPPASPLTPVPPPPVASNGVPPNGDQGTRRISTGRRPPPPKPERFEPPRMAPPPPPYSAT